MALFKSTSTKLEVVKESPFKLEREIQRLFENNLPLIMGLEFVKSEFTSKNKRMSNNNITDTTTINANSIRKRNRNSNRKVSV